MTVKEDLEAYVANTFAEQWAKRNGQKVPETGDLALKNDAVLLDAVVLYADLSASTALVSSKTNAFAAEVYKNYLYCAARVIRMRGGTITAYDGDRVMAVFIGSDKNSSAAKAALQINWATRNIVQPALEKQYPKSTYKVQQKVGVDSSELMIARTGIRGSNDLVWVGNAANNAAKMAALDLGYSSYITARTYNSLSAASKVGADGRNMWKNLGSDALGYTIYGSTWWWSF